MMAKSFSMRDDGALDDRAFEARRTAERFVEQRGEISALAASFGGLRRALPLAIQYFSFIDPGRNAAARRPTG